MRHKNVKAVGDFINTRKVKLKTFLDCGATRKCNLSATIGRIRIKKRHKGLKMPF
jgi:hypothetical protein